MCALSASVRSFTVTFVIDRLGGEEMFFNDCPLKEERRPHLPLVESGQVKARGSPRKGSRAME